MLKNRGLASKGAEVTGAKRMSFGDTNTIPYDKKTKQKAIQMRRYVATQQMKFAVCTKCKKSSKEG